MWVAGGRGKGAEEEVRGLQVGVGGCGGVGQPNLPGPGTRDRPGHRVALACVSGSAWVRALTRAPREAGRGRGAAGGVVGGPPAAPPALAARPLAAPL